jgi:hypothetical protein
MKLRAWPRMVERHKSAARPSHCLTEIAAQLKSMWLYCIKRCESDSAESNDQGCVNNRQGLAQPCSTVRQFASSWRSVVPAFVARIAQHRVRNENALARNTRGVEQTVEIPASLVIRQGRSGSIPT